MLASFPPALLKRLSEAISSIYLTRSSAEEKRQSVKVAREANVEYARLNHAIDVSKFFVKSFLDPEVAGEDSAEAIADDLLALSFIPHAAATPLKEFLTRLKDEAAKIKATERERAHVTKCIPMLSR